MIEVGTHHYYLVRATSGNDAEHVAEVHALVYVLLYLCDGVGIHKESYAALQLLVGISLEGLLIALAEKRLDTSLTKTRDDILLGDARTTLTGTATLKKVVSKEIDVGTGGILGDGGKTRFLLAGEQFGCRLG